MIVNRRRKIKIETCITLRGSIHWIRCRVVPKATQNINGERGKLLPGRESSSGYSAVSDEWKPHKNIYVNLCKVLISHSLIWQTALYIYNCVYIRLQVKMTFIRRHNSPELEFLFPTFMWIFGRIFHQNVLNKKNCSKPLNIRPSKGKRSSVVGWCTMLQTGRPQVQFPMRPLYFSIGLILPDALCPWGRLNF
jgi:hypothetical protein